MINAKTEHLIQRELINIDATMRLLEKYAHCETCDCQTKIDTNTQCPDCIYYKGSKKFVKPDGTAIYRIAGKHTIFGPLGFLTEDHIGRTDLVYKYNHPELNWKPYPIPKWDIFGKRTTENSYFEHHHYVIYYDDKHVIRVLNTEHRTIEAMARRGDLSLVNILLQTRERHPSLEPGVLMNKQQLKEYYKQNKLIRI